MSGRFKFDYPTPADTLEKIANLLINPCYIKCEFVHKAAELPKKNNELDACWDFFVVPDDSWHEGPEAEQYILMAGKSHLFHTGIACEIPEGRSLYLWDRSGLGARHNIHRLAGVIDCTYRGEIMVSLINLSDKNYTFNVGDRIIQAQLTLTIPSRMVKSEELSDTERGTNGFGSSGR